MSIESTPFGGTKLTGEDARKFRNQARYGRPKGTAVEAVRRGVELAEQIATDGFARIAIAIEARQRTDPEEGLDPKGESAGPQDIAKGPSQ